MTLQNVLDAVAAALPLAFRHEDLDAIASRLQGVEAMVYPYLNRQLIDRLDMSKVIAVGAGRISSDRRDEIDSLIVRDDGTA